MMSEFTTLASILWSTVFAVKGTLIVALNLLTIVACTINRELTRRSLYCAINLATADLLFGATTIPLYVYYLTQLPILNGGPNFGHTVEIVHALTSTVSLFGLVLVALERLYATLHPLQHYIARKRAYTLPILLTWIMSIISGIMIYFLGSYHRDSVVYILVSLFIVSASIICGSYVTVFVKVKEERHFDDDNIVEEAALRRAMGRQNKLAKTLLIVSMASLLTWVPFVIVDIFTIFIKSTNLHLQLGITALQCTNSLVNPIIYFVRIKELRKAMIQLVLHCSRDHQTEPQAVVDLPVGRRTSETTGNPDDNQNSKTSDQRL